MFSVDTNVIFALVNYGEDCHAAAKTVLRGDGSLFLSSHAVKETKKLHQEKFNERLLGFVRLLKKDKTNAVKNCKALDDYAENVFLYNRIISFWEATESGEVSEFVQNAEEGANLHTRDIKTEIAKAHGDNFTYYKRNPKQYKKCGEIGGLLSGVVFQDSYDKKIISDVWAFMVLNALGEADFYSFDRDFRDVFPKAHEEVKRRYKNLELRFNLVRGGLAGRS